MASLVTILPSVAFPHEVEALDISSTAATAVELRYADTIIFKSVLYPMDGTIALREVNSLLNGYLGSEEHTFSVWLDGSKVGETTIIPCNLNLDCTAEEWNGCLYLSRATIKYTHLQAKELLPLYCPDGGTAYLTAVFRLEGAPRILKTKVSFTETDGIGSWDMSPANLYPFFPYNVELLEEYSIQIGSSTMRYRMIPDGMADNVHEFGFINSFNQEEYITLLGAAERELKVERLHAMVGGHYRNYQVEAVPHWTIKSGMMLEGMEGLFDDFISSKKVWRKSDGAMMAVTDSDFKVSDANDATCEGSVTLRETGRTYRHRPVRPVKTFDETFDDTFR